MFQTLSYPLKNAVLGAVSGGRLHWLGLRLSRLILEWQDLKRRTKPLRIRWGLALLLAVVLVLVIGECSPAASAIAAQL